MNLFVDITPPDSDGMKVSLSIDNIREIHASTVQTGGYTKIVFVRGEQIWAIEPRADIVAEITEIQDSAARKLALAQRLTK